MNTAQNASKAYKTCSESAKPANHLLDVTAGGEAARAKFNKSGGEKNFPDVLREKIQNRG